MAGVPLFFYLMMKHFNVHGLARAKVAETLVRLPYVLCISGYLL